MGSTRLRVEGEIGMVYVESGEGGGQRRSRRVRARVVATIHSRMTNVNQRTLPIDWNIIGDTTHDLKTSELGLFGEGDDVIHDR
mmetsp:Transcript_40622/g.108706  ORF Transcript_40622/g.108706 Transcript_40622/m.108706 type:complete len:84 (+) Transcript_40622:770-1021(+)